MNSWDKKILNERMFEYYEGTLSSDKSIELLELVNQNPEAEAEFANWAQTYALKHTDLKEYNLHTTLIRQPSAKVKYLKWSSLLILLFALTYSGFLFFTNEKESHTNYKSPIYVKNIPTEKKSTEVNVHSNKVAKNGKVVSMTLPIKNENLASQRRLLSLDSLINTTNVDSAIFIAPIQDPIMVKDSAEFVTNELLQKTLIPAESKKEKQVKSKKRSALKIQPNQGEILQTNPNF